MVFGIIFGQIKNPLPIIAAYIKICTGINGISGINYRSTPTFMPFMPFLPHHFCNESAKFGTFWGPRKF